MSRKLYIVFSNYTSSYFDFCDLFHSRKLEEFNLHYQSQFTPFWQTYALDHLSSQFSAYILYKYIDSDPINANAALGIIRNTIKELAGAIDKNKDYLWLLGNLDKKSIEVLSKFVKDEPNLADRQIVTIILMERQDNVLAHASRIKWKDKSYQLLNKYVMPPGCYPDYFVSYETLKRLFGDVDAIITDSDNLTGKFNSRRIMETCLNLPANFFDDSEYPFPKSYAGLDVHFATFAFPFSKYGKVEHDRRAFYSTLCHLEREEGFAQVEGQPAECRQYLAMFTEGNNRLARQLGQTSLFQNCADKPLFPQPLPSISYEQARTIVSAIEPSLRHGLLRFFRDSMNDLPVEAKTLAKAIDDYRQKFIPSSGFTYPRKQPVLTVLTMTRNHKDYIMDCMESVAAQKTDFHLEHIIVDDASDDGTQDIVDNFASVNPHIRPIYIPNRSGGGYNIRTLFNACKSEFAALCDGDDYFSKPEKLQNQVDFISRNRGCSVCFHPVLVKYEGNTKESFIYPPVDLLPRGQRKKHYLSDLLQANFIQTNSAVYRWRFRDGLPDWFRSDLCPSDWYWHILHAETGWIGFIPEVMSVYRRHASSYYNNSFIDTIEHRRQHGMSELKTYQAINDHLKGIYFKQLASLANGVFADFLKLQCQKDNSSLLDEACEKFPQFGMFFLKSLEIVNRTPCDTNNVSRSL